MSLWKNCPKIWPNPFFVKIHTRYKLAKIWATLNFKKIHKSKQLPKNGNSPNLVTLFVCFVAYANCLFLSRTKQQAARTLFSSNAMEFFWSLNFFAIWSIFRATIFHPIIRGDTFSRDNFSGDNLPWSLDVVKWIWRSRAFDELGFDVVKIQWYKRSINCLSINCRSTKKISTNWGSTNWGSTKCRSTKCCRPIWLFRMTLDFKYLHMYKRGLLNYVWKRICTHQ
jgi:hypothetical protein